MVAPASQSGKVVAATSNPLVRRVVAAMGANAVGQGVSVLIQLLSLPLFLHVWSADTYGVWLMLSAFPAYLSMADVGMVTVAGNRMTIDIGQGQVAEANRVFQSAQVFVLAACAALALISVPLVWLMPGSVLQSADQRVALTALIGAVLLTLWGGLSEALFRATERYALGTFLSNMVRLAEWAGWMGGLLLDGSLTAVAVGGLLMRGAGTLWMGRLSGADAKGLQWGLAQASRSEVVVMVKPALSFMAFPLANAISFQGVTLLVGQQLGMASVAMFNAYRTLARVAVQVTGILGHSLWAEFSLLYGQGGASAVRPVYLRSAWLGGLMALALSMALFVVAPYLLRYWTHGVVEFVSVPMALMLAYATVGGLWHVPRILLLSTNQHIGLAQWSLVAALLVVLLTLTLGERLGISGVTLAMLLSEGLIAGVCLIFAQRFLTSKLIANTGHQDKFAG